MPLGTDVHFDSLSNLPRVEVQPQFKDPLERKRRDKTTAKIIVSCFLCSLRMLSAMLNE
jgi:hypothetical protein